MGISHKRGFVDKKYRSHQATLRRETHLLSIGTPMPLLHGLTGGGYLDEIITLGLLAGLVIGLTFLSFRGTRNKNKKIRRRNKRGRKR